MTCDEQLNEWVKGNSIHNKERDECCPDFSCCNPKMLAPLEARKWFAEHPEDRDKMLMMFLNGALTELSNKKIYLAGESKMPVV